jgi:hypothetical protein
VKMGDEMAVTMEGLHVANAVIEEVDRDAGEVTMYIPATRFIVGLSENIVDKNPEPTRELLTDQGLEEKPAQQSASGNGQSPFQAPERVTEPISEPRRGIVETAAERELREAYAGTTSLADMNLDSSAID